MIIYVFIFLSASAIAVFLIANYTKQISHLTLSVIINLICALSPFTAFDLVKTAVTTNSTLIAVFNATTNTTTTTSTANTVLNYTKAYFDTTTAIVLSAMFMFAMIVSILQIWNVVGQNVKRGVKKGDYDNWRV
jgi:hypothetical protein